MNFTCLLPAQIPVRMEIMIARVAILERNADINAVIAVARITINRSFPFAILVTFSPTTWAKPVLKVALPTTIIAQIRTIVDEPKFLNPSLKLTTPVSTIAVSPRSAVTEIGSLFHIKSTTHTPKIMRLKIAVFIFYFSF